MKIRKFGELNEERKYKKDVDFNPGEFMTAGHLMDYLRRNIPRETLIFFRGCDRPITLISKDEMMNHMPEVQDIFIHENKESEYFYKEWGKYTCFDEDEEQENNGENVENFSLKQLEPFVTKGIVINKYM